MPRSKKPMEQEPGTSLLKFREKRKWQIALRRYVLEKFPCRDYAPYFALDIENMRKWFEYQFTNGQAWENFGKKWQFDHILPVAYFDFSNEAELKMCWNFTNLRVGRFEENKNNGNRMNFLAAKNYFKELYEKTSYMICQKLLNKIDEIESAELIHTDVQKKFIQERLEYLKITSDYSAFEFELLNSGRSIEEVNKEIEFSKNLERRLGI